MGNDPSTFGSLNSGLIPGVGTANPPSSLNPPPGTAPSPTVTTTNVSSVPAPNPFAQPAPTGFASNQDLIANQALGSIFNPQLMQFPEFQMPDLSFQGISAPSFGGGGGGGTNINVSPINTSGGAIDPNQFNTMSGATANVPSVISDADIQNALQFLQNPTSVFDQMSGGPIVQEIQDRTDAMQEAFRTQQLDNLSRGIERSRSGLASEGVLSGSDVLRMDNELIDNVMNDIMVFESGMGLENTRYLGDLAMRDIENRTNSMAQILTQALVQRGQDAALATANADRISREVIAGQEIKLQTNIANLQSQTQREIANLDAITRAKIATADINARMQLGQLEAQTNAQIANLNAQTQMNIARLDNARALQLGTQQQQTQLALGQMGASTDLLGLMQQDFQNQQANMLNTGQLPLNLLAGLGGPLNVSSGSSSSK